MKKAAKLKQNNHKLFLLSLKLLPPIMAVGCFLSTVFQYFYIEEIITTELCFAGILPILFLVFTSYVFKFCEYHRIYLYYIILNEVMNIINYNVELNITDTVFIRIHIIVFFIATLLTTILYLYGRKDKHITQFTTEGD